MTYGAFLLARRQAKCAVCLQKKMVLILRLLLIAFHLDSLFQSHNMYMSTSTCLNLNALERHEAEKGSLISFQKIQQLSCLDGLPWHKMLTAGIGRYAGWCLFNIEVKINKEYSAQKCPIFSYWYQTHILPARLAATSLSRPS